MNRTVTKVRELKQNYTADLLEENKAKFKQYLIKQNWSQVDMTTHKCFKDNKGYTCYGKQTDNRLINTNGVKIYPYDGDVDVTKPRIFCNEDDFDIYE